jgi:3-oxoacyl-[acyl-carrier protein] reductase
MAGGVKVALLAGAGGTVGTAVAARLAEDGYATATLADVRDRGAIAERLDAAEAELGPVSVLVNDARWSPEGPLDELSEEDWDRTLATNVKGGLLLTQELAARMIEAERPGAIVQIGRDGGSGSAPFRASQGGLVALGKGLALELAAHRIRVNTVIAGPPAELQPNSESLRSLVGTVAFLASPRADFVTGSCIDTYNGGKQ